MERTITLLIAGIFGIYLTDIYLLDGSSVGLAIEPVYWYGLTLGATVAGALLSRRLHGVQLPYPLVVWISFYFFYVGFNFIYSSQSPVAVQHLVTAIEMGAMFICFLLLLQIYGPRSSTRKLFVMVALVAVLLNFYDFFIPTWSSVSGRAAGLYGNPNLSATMLTLCMIASIPVVLPRYRLWFCLLIGAAVLLTFSRAGWLQWAIAFTGLSIYGAVRTSRLIAVATVAGAAIVIYLLFSGSGMELFSGVGLDQYLNHSVIARLNNPLSDDSASWRLAMALKALHIFMQHPLVGAGMAATREWNEPVGPHDMYVYLAAEGGLVGLALLVSLLVTTWRLSWGPDRLLIVIFAVDSLFSHNNLEKPELFLILALAASVRHDRAASKADSHEAPGAPVNEHLHTPSYALRTQALERIE